MKVKIITSSHQFNMYAYKLQQNTIANAALSASHHWPHTQKCTAQQPPIHNTNHHVHGNANALMTQRSDVSATKRTLIALQKYLNPANKIR